MLLKTILRTIRQSLGRYLAILFIIALGVGFFAGLRVTEEAMLKTADKYIGELNLYDFRLVSTLGFTEDDKEAFCALDGIENACGSVSADFIYVKESGADAVLRAHTLLENINGLDIRCGRLPASPYECVLDAKYADDGIIGKKITLSKSNSEDTFDIFAYDEYTVVGLVNAAEYINFERGTTSLGSGSVSGYIYIQPDGFSVDYYTEIYLTIPKCGKIYSDEYIAAVDAVREDVENMLGERAEIRYNTIYSDAKTEVDDAQKELDLKKQELDDAQKEIDDGKAEYLSTREEAENELSETKALLDEMRSELDAAAASLEALKNDPSAQLPEAAAKLEAMEAELQGKEKLYFESLASYEQASSSAEEQFEEKAQELADAQRKIDDGRLEVDDAQTEIDKAKSELSEIKSATVYTLDRRSNTGYASLENDTAIVSGVAKVFPLFFFLVAALVCITTMTRMVSEGRTENGVLKALGYSSSAIAGKYLFYAGSASAVGCILGFLIGSRYMPMALWQVYHILYSIERPIEFVLDWKLFAQCSALYLFCALSATWFVCQHDMRESAAGLMRPKAPAAGKRILLERIGFIWNHIKFLHKISIRNIMLYKKRMLMMILGIGGCTALLLTGFGIRDTISPIADRQYDEIELYDASVSFISGMDDVSKQAFIAETEKAAKETAFLYTANADVSKSGKTENINLVVFASDPSDFINLHEGNTALPAPTEGEAVVNYRFADANGISKGDTLEVTDETYGTLTVTVSGIFDNYIYDYIYISSDTCEKQWGVFPDCNTAYVIFADGQDERAAGAILLGAENVANVTLSSDMKTRIGNMMESLNYIVLIVLVCASALAFIVLYNLTNITITERSREIATLKVLGFYQKEQNYYVFRENIVLTGISTVCGIPMGILLLRYVMSQIKISTLYFGCRLMPISYFLAVLITFAFIIIVDAALTYKTKNISMTEAMKAVE